nr:hypothetical protein [Tanacetum cinerariifolium]
DALVDEHVTRDNSLDSMVSKSLESINLTFDNNMPSKVSPSDPIVQYVYINEQPSSYVGTKGGSKMKPCKARTTLNSTMKGNIPMSNPYSALDDKSDEDIENMFDESTNLFQSTKMGGSLATFTDATGTAEMLKEWDFSYNDHPIDVSSNDEVEFYMDTDDTTPNKEVVEAKAALLKAWHSYPNITQFTKHLVTTVRPEFKKLLKGQDFSAHLLAKPKVLPAKMDEFTKSLGDLKKYVKKVEMDFHKNLKEIPTKLIECSNSLSTLTTWVRNLEGFKLELPTDLLTMFDSFTNVSYQVANLKVLDDIPDIMNKVAASLDRFANEISSAFNRVETSGDPSARQVFTPLVEGENITKTNERIRTEPIVLQLF